MGKSSLTNALLPHANLKIGALVNSAQVSQGAHTTSSSRLFFLSGASASTSTNTSDGDGASDIDIDHVSTGVGTGVSASDSTSTSGNVVSTSSRGSGSSSSSSSSSSSDMEEDIRRGGIIIDSPGIREIGLWHLPLEIVKAGFSEIDDLAPSCR